MRRSISLLLLALTTTQLPAQNILNNGGFESGLMCWNEWVVSSTFVDGAGDYRFAVSTDTRPGSFGAYSIEIECEGSDCYKGYVYTNNFPAVANQSYQLSYWAKCPSGGAVYISPAGRPVTPTPGNPEIYGYAVCDGTWHQNQVTFTSNDSAFTSGYIRIALNAFQTSWAIFDDVALTYGDGTAPPHVVLHPGARNVSISGQTVNVDSSPFLSLGFYDVGYDDLAQVAATGANTINGVGSGYNSADCYNLGKESYLDLVYDLGMNFVPDSTITARLANTSTMATARHVFAPHLANIGWTLADEPDLWAWPFFVVSPANFIAEYTVGKAQSPLPITADFQRASYDATALPPYNGSVDIWMAEPYGTSFGSTSFAINLFNSVQRLPIWLAQDDIGTLIVPKAYFAVIQGATGIHYFAWDTFKADPVGLAAAKQVFSELSGLKNAIFGQKMDSLVAAPANVVAMSRFDPTTGNVYILAANGVTSNTLTGSFRVQGLAAGQTVTVLNENRTITASAGSLTDTFAGISRHVYVIPTTAPTVSFTGAPASAVYGSSFTVMATTNATTTATISASGACSNSGDRVTMVSGSGTCYLTASWGADVRYSAATATQSATATMATPVIAWSAPAAITFGSALGSSQLDATASVPGVFAYTPAAGTVLPAGAGQTLSVTFWPNDWVDYATTSASTTITINPAPARRAPPPPPSGPPIRM